MRHFFYILIAIFIVSCSNKNKSELSGGEIRMCINSEPITHISYEVSDYYSAIVFGQVMEGLVSLDPHTLKVTPQIASSWKISDDGMTYTFDIRNDVYFHNHPAFGSKSERLLKISDIIKTFEVICTPTQKGTETVSYSYLLKENLLGAEDYFNKKEKTIKGIKEVDGKLQITLTQKDDNFLNKLAQIQLAIQSEKIINADAITDIVGTGPFYFNKYVNGEPPYISLAKNEDYYELDEQGKQLPYLDSIKFYIQNRKLEQLDMFENKEIDLILELPTSKITKMVEGRLADFNSTPPLLMLYKNPTLNTHYFNFNMNDPRFADVRVRQAFIYAFDKERLGREVLKNQYNELGYYGIVPPLSSVFKGYDFNEVKKYGYNYNPEKAKKLLAEAGYPNGKGFGSVNLRFSIGDVNSAVADEFAQQIFQVLGINVNIDGSTFEQLNTDAIEGNGDLFKSSWIADYPKPENFLMNFISSNIPTAERTAGLNYSKYSNPTFDKYVEEGNRESNIGKKLNLYSKAEIEMLKNPPLIPLWYTGDIEIAYSNVRNLYFNSLSYFNFKKVYLKPWTAEEYQKEITSKK
ncbi:MAG: peptide ABC transporter substrate-binding protein [Crocinitomicaceae bacterium]|nr:peptide ABC transporter substrate-binding protein [Crocinitomicaceae bacterium]